LHVGFQFILGDCGHKYFMVSSAPISSRVGAWKGWRGRCPLRRW
jgi:hypothetical protein